ncbi:Zn-dependent alcohol dehydrogenase [Sphingomonas sp. MG17]|jgi:S-(hydroxymethyl)glutathione dehydrogenase/alcohol dehydrogenase|uniref:Zn-dependent alcohol dehydrogenase n=1 Tax=Sphingomonas tagetis TaxID=2949092 RepID=A0A9X2HSI6_9SPHN|nr:Zn-dependent alcohol dehydrogenase [Sphingomonas tagetis]MCP3732784.1 Zn-dependent alcohol dehydrogenase [Sphingomonas tagetis]
MKAAVLNALDGTFQVEAIDISEPQGREVLVEVKACGLCHSDHHFATTNFGIPLPAVLGHELAGVVKAIGPDVRDFAVGDHVVGSLLQFCGHCTDCLSGRTYQCSHPEETRRGAHDEARLTREGAPVTQGFGMGAFAELSLVHENQLANVPKELPFPQASILGCGTVTGAGAAINTAGVRPGETVAVVGIGGVGLNVISGAALAGASRIIAIDIQPSKGELAGKFGATDFIDGSDEDTAAQVHALVPGGVDHAFEVVGIKATSQQVIKMVRRGGTAYMIGMHAPDKTIDVNVTLDLLRNQIAIKGVVLGSSNIKRDIPMFAQLYLQGKLNLDDLISREINIAEINDAYQELMQGEIARSVITSF